MIDQSEETAFDVAVVGAGAAGQMVAIAAAQAGRRVVLLEQMDRPGLKVLASGGGRCNLTNLVASDAFISAFGRQGRFITSAMAALGPADLRELLKRWGVPTIVNESGQVYPASQRAGDVQAALGRRLRECGVEIRLRCRVARLWIEGGRLAGLELATGERIAAPRVVLACGGRSWPKLGGAGIGYDLARQAGLAIADPLAALVPLVTAERWPGRLAGVSLHDARVRIDIRGQDRAGVTGDVLFTHRGLSGPAVLDLSGRVSELLRRGPVPLRIECVAGTDAAAWTQRLEDWRGSAGRRRLGALLQEHLPRALCDELCRQGGVDAQCPIAQLPAAGRDALAALLGAAPLTVTATEGFAVAFVTRGGVKLQGIDPDTLESRTLAGLYLAGELLDLDGPTGGYNLQWAFASGYLAGKSAARD